jgi:hypothetical protein
VVGKHKFCKRLDFFNIQNLGEQHFEVRNGFFFLQKKPNKKNKKISVNKIKNNTQKLESENGKGDAERRDILPPDLPKALNCVCSRKFSLLQFLS